MTILDDYNSMLTTLKAIVSMKDTASIVNYAQDTISRVTKTDYNSPEYGDWFSLTEDGDYAADVLYEAADAVDMEEGTCAEFTRSITLGKAFVIRNEDDEYEVFATEEEANERLKDFD